MLWNKSKEEEEEKEKEEKKDQIINRIQNGAKSKQWCGSE